MTPRALPVWRSVLFVPVNVEKFVAKAAGVGADALKLDLEDSIGPSDKDSARKMAPDVARRLNEAGDEVMVRVNRPWRLLVRDLEAVVGPHVSTIVLPKADSPDLIKAVSEVIGEMELERGVPVGSTQLMLLIESAEGYLRMPEIAKADPRVVAITLGSEDFGLSLGMTADPETLYAPATQVVVAASAAGVIPWGFVGSIAEYKDIDRLRGIVQLHPPQPGADLQRGVRPDRRGGRRGTPARRRLRRGPGAGPRVGRDRRQDGRHPDRRAGEGRHPPRRCAGRAGAQPRPLNRFTPDRRTSA